MDEFTRADLRLLGKPISGPCISIFTATRRGIAADNRVRWEDQLRDAREKLAQRGFSQESIDQVMQPTHTYLNRGAESFWQHTLDGMATFLAPGFHRLFRLPIRLADQVTVGSHFQLTPLLSFVNDDGRFFVLALSQNQVRLLEGTAHSWRRVDVPGIPSSLTGSRPAHDRDEPLNLHTHRGGQGDRSQAVFHGQGVGIDDHKKELLTYCQAIDHALLHVLGEGHAPLVLATITELAAIYQKASRYNHLHEEIVHGSPDKSSDAELHDKGWKLVAPQIQALTQRATDQYRQLAGTGRTTDRIEELLPAARRGELETVLVASEQPIWGKFEPENERVEILQAGASNAEDLASLAVAYAVERERNAFVVERNALGGATIAGIYFTPMNKHGKAVHHSRR